MLPNYNPILRHFEGESLEEVWMQLLMHLLVNPEYSPSPRGLETREILGVQLLIRDLRKNIITHPARNLNYRYLIAEWMWIAFGRSDVATLIKYNSKMSRFSDDGEKLAGAYGPRLHHQWDYVRQALRDPDSRQAVAVIWTPNPPKSKDIPCTLTLQFLVRGNKLNVIATMRSSDTWLGIPYDVFVFSMLANSLAGELGLDTGFIEMNLGSSHLYSDNFKQAEQVFVNSQDCTPTIMSPLLPGWPSPELTAILERPEDFRDQSFTYLLDVPWCRYAKILIARTWREAKELLAE